MLDGVTILGLLFWIIGILVGFIGILIGMYSLIKQKNLETRIKEKEKLKMLSKHIENDIIPYISRVIDLIKDPLKNDDTEFQIYYFSLEIVSKAFDEQKDIVNIETNVQELIRLKEGNEKEKMQYKKIDLNNKEYVIKHLEECKLDLIIVDCTVGSSEKYMLGDILMWLKKIYCEVTDLETEFENLIDEFKPKLINDLKNCTKEIFIIVLNSSINSKEIEINIKTFTKTDNIGFLIYNKVIGRDELDSCLDKLLQLKAELEEFRETLIMTSYT